MHKCLNLGIGLLCEKVCFAGNQRSPSRKLDVKKNSGQKIHLCPHSGLCTILDCTKPALTLTIPDQLQLRFWQTIVPLLSQSVVVIHIVHVFYVVYFYKPDTHKKLHDLIAFTSYCTKSLGQKN